MLIKLLVLSFNLNPLVYLYQDLKALLNDSINLFDISSSKPLITMWVDISNVFLIASLDLFKLQEIMNLVSESIQIQR